MIDIYVVGNLGRDATINVVNGKSVINFSVCHSRKYKNAQNVDVTKTIWVECSWWRDNTTVAQYLKQGQQVVVRGEPDARGWLNKNKHNEVSASLTCRVNELQLVGSPKGKDAAQTQQVPHNTNMPEQNPTAPSDITEPVDDLPF